MNKILNAVKEKLNMLRQNSMLRTVLISVMALLLIFSVTLAWYINNLGLWGMQFNTGNIDFNAYVYSENGTQLVGPVSSNGENETTHLNAPLITLNDAQVGSIGIAYIVVESTGSIGIDYRIAFDITGRDEKSTAYLGGYKYNISKVTDKVTFTGAGNIDVSRCPAPEQINDDIVTIDRNAVSGSIAKKNGYEVYRVDYSLVQKNQEYTGTGINIYFNIFATQIGGQFEDTSERAYTYYCSTREDIDRARVEAYPGDIIKLSSNIVYYGDLVFNKPVSLETNDYSLTVNGNLIYDYVLGNSLRLDAGGLGTVVVQCTQDGVGGALKIKAPIGDVTLIGSNAANGDFIIEKGVTIDATNAYGSAGVSFNEVRIVDLKNSRKTIQLESNTRATISFGTTIGLLQSVVKASNIEIINNGEIGEINLSNMSVLPQTNSPQIYILNNNDINNPIMLPSWSEKFVQDADGKCTGNTRIIQSYSGSPTMVTGTCPFNDSHIEVERKDFYVEPIYENNDSRLKIYYQEIDGQNSSIQSILEDYFRYEATTDCTIAEVLQLEIISIGSKAITVEDLAYLNGNELLALRQLDMQRANMYDRVADMTNRLPDNAFRGVSKYTELVLPQNLVEIGANAFYGSNIKNSISIPSGVLTYGTNWFYNGLYVHFASSVPVAHASSGMTSVDAIFVDEAYISSYKSTYTSFADKIFPTSVLDESKQHFIRNTMNNEWEITYFIQGDDPVIGQNITMDGEILKITSVYENAYRFTFTGKSVDFADTVERLGAYNFYNNQNITEVNLNNLKTVGDYAFWSCAGLAKLEIGEYLENIGIAVFYKCGSLNQDIVLPDTMEKIGADAFTMTKITSVNTGGTTSIDGRAFYYCSSMVYAEMPCVTVIAENGTNQLFANCSKLVSVDMPSLITSNVSGLFLNCGSLREIYLGTNDDGFTLGGNPFNTPTTNLKIFVPEAYLEFYQTKRPGGVKAEMIYPRGEKLGEQLVNDFNIGEYIVSNNGDDTYTLVTSNISHSGDYYVPNEYKGHPITKIYANAYRNQTFSNVTAHFGDHLESIGTNAFYGHTNLVGVFFGDSLKEIGPSAFESCTNIKHDIKLPDTMEKIGTRAFRSTGISSVNTGGTKLIESDAFTGCGNLLYAKMPEVIQIDNGSTGTFVNCTKLVSVEMPNLYNATGSKMFMNCTSLTELIMGSNNSSISLGTTPFSGITNTQKIKLLVPEDLVSHYQERAVITATQIYPDGDRIGDYSVNGYRLGDYVVMKNDSGYTLVTSFLSFEGEVSAPEEHKGQPITAVYSNAFRAQSFKNVVYRLPDTVTTIGSSAFFGVTGLNSVIMDQVTNVEGSAFYQSSIQLLNAPNLVSIGESAFSNCTKLENVSLPKIEAIENRAVFSGCTNLKTVYFENVTSLHNNTFYSCRKLEKITINRLINSDGSNMPATMTIDASAPCKIYVPYRALSYYPATWSGKPVVSFDLSLTAGGHTYILANRNGQYAVIDFVPGGSTSWLNIPATFTDSQLGQIKVYSIEPGAFISMANSLTTITLSNNIVKLENGALSECKALTTIKVSEQSKYFTSIGGILYSKDSKMLVKCPAGKTGTIDLSTADYAATVGIGATAFEGSSLTKIVFPAGLAVIDSTAFNNCSNLATVEFTGNTPPVLMGASIFDTSVDGFEMVIPTSNSSVVTAYLCAYNFAEYEPYIDLKGNAAPSASATRNQVSLNGLSTSSVTYAMLPPSKAEETPEDDTTGE